MAVEITGASSAREEAWSAIKWRQVESQVRRLQMRIAKATQEKRYGKVRALQWMLTHSYSAKVLAIRRVTSNKGSNTPGVDGIIWNTAKRKYEAIKELQRRGYRARPLRRIYIPKKQGQRRALGIPALRDRAMQALYLLALEPVAEINADPNSYGFRAERSTQDAIEYCFMMLSRRNCAEWILEADIQSCFDHISHEWLQTHVVTDRQVLQQWLKAGYLEKQQFYFTEEGTPQGGVISPTLANIVLDGLERTVKAASSRKEKVNVARYADDFIVTGASPEVLERLKGVIELFLAERGLKLSAKKTKITSVYHGFDFLGFHVKKHKNALLTKPAKTSIKKIRATINEVTRRNVATPTVNLIRQLNPKLQGWANYYRYVVSSRAFAAIDHAVFKAVWRWAKHRHPKKNATWIRAHYFRQRRNRQWIFFANIIDEQRQKRPLDIVIVNSIAIKRHVKVKAKATPYDAAYRQYFEQRRQRNKPSSAGYWVSCNAPFYFS